MVYVSLIGITIIFGTFAQVYNQAVNNEINARKKNKYGFFYYILFFAFWFISAFRYYVGTDYGSYYKNIYTLEQVKESFKQLDEPIIKLITYISRSIYDDGAFVIIVLATLITVFVFIGISKYDNNDICLTLLFYIFTGCLAFSFNGVRQALAISFIFAFSKKEEKHWILRYIVVIIVAFLIHKSSLVLLPVLLFANMRYSKRNLMIITISGLIVPLFFNYAYDLMGTDFESQDALMYINREINPLRVAVAIVVVLIVLFVNNKEEFFEHENFVFNMTIYNAMFTLATMNSAYLNRITHFMTLFIPVYIPKVLKRMPITFRFFATVSSVILYFIYWLYEQDGDFLFQWTFSHFGEY